MSQNTYEYYSSIDIVQRLIDDDTVFFIGESPTCALPLAVAAMRGSLDGVWAAGYESYFEYEDLKKVFDDWYDRFWRNAEIFRQSYRKVGVHDPEAQGRIRRVQDSRNLTIELLKHQFSSSSSVDASRLTWTIAGKEYMIPPRNIFWMCPWCLYADTRLGDLLCSFIRAAAAIQGEGDMLLLGLAVDHYKWGSYYRFEDVEAVAQEHGYLVLPRDRRFVDEALRHGYVHHTPSDPGADDKLHGPLFWELEVHPFLKRSACTISLGAELPSATMNPASLEELVQVAEGQRRVTAEREYIVEDNLLQLYAPGESLVRLMDDLGL